MTGGADVGSASYNAATGLFSYANIVPDGANQCINGDCSLPGETTILNSECQSSVSVFTVDYDAPRDCHASLDMRSLLMPLMKYANSSKIVGGLNGTATVFGNSTSTSSGRNGTVTSTSTGSPHLRRLSLPALDMLQFRGSPLPLACSSPLSFACDRKTFNV
jgi:hypothetical protein